jgi:hypothetical protein
MSARPIVTEVTRCSLSEPNCAELPNTCTGWSDPRLAPVVVAPFAVPAAEAARIGLLAGGLAAWRALL